jgi:TolB protein
VNLRTPLMATCLVAPCVAAHAQPAATEKDRVVTAVEDDYPAWSPDGSRLVFYSNRDGSGFMQIFVVGVDGTGLVQLTRTASHNRTPVFSPDGKAILFQAERDGNREIYLMGADGSAPRNLTRNPAEDSHPKFLPGGRGFVFDSLRDDAAAEELYTLELDGSGLRRITHEAAVDTYASVSPDGSRLLWRRMLATGGSSAGGRNSEIFVSARDGSSPVNVSNHPAFDGYPAWTPDGRRIVFASNRVDDPARQGAFAVYAMDADGSNLVRLTDPPESASDVRPSVSPDGRRVAFNRDWPDGAATIHVIELPEPRPRERP